MSHVSSSSSSTAIDKWLLISKSGISNFLFDAALVTKYTFHS